MTTATLERPAAPEQAAAGIQPDRRRPAPDEGLVRQPGAGQGARAEGRQRLRDGQRHRDPAHLRLPARVPRDQLAADRREEGVRGVPARLGGLRLLARRVLLREGRRGPDPAPAEAPVGHDPARRHRHHLEHVQHVHQVGRDLGAHAQDADLHAGPARPARRRLAGAPRRRPAHGRLPVGRGAVPRTDHPLREHHRQALQLRPAGRGAGPRQPHGLPLEQRDGAQPGLPRALQRDARRADLHRHHERLPRHRGRRGVHAPAGGAAAREGGARRGARARGALPAAVLRHALLRVDAPAGRAVRELGRRVRLFRLPDLRRRRHGRGRDGVRHLAPAGKPGRDHGAGGAARACRTSSSRTSGWPSRSRNTTSTAWCSTASRAAASSLPAWPTRATT